MSEVSRRDFGRLAGGVVAGVTALPHVAIAQAKPRVVIVGGGAGGATVAHYLKKDAPNVEVTLIEANPTYSSSFFSNLYVGGIREYSTLNHNYNGLRKLGVKVVHEFATEVDAAKKVVKTRGGDLVPYDKLVLSPGIAIKYDSVPGYTVQLAETIPHAYMTAGGPKQILRSQLTSMKDGGTVVMVMPPNPYRCPPGPYERACMIAHYLKTKKPKSKLVILDPKKAFSKQPVFTEAFEKYYKDIIDLKLTTDIDDYVVTALDAKTREFTTKAGFKVKADVANVIPAQKAGDIAFKAGVTQGDWVPVNPEDFSSKAQKDTYVLGDATIAAEMPKSAFSANSQAKVVAGELLAEFAKKEKFPARFRNTCWSLVAPDDCIKIGANYAPKDGKLDPSGSFVSQKGEDAAVRKQNYAESVGWYDGIIADMFAKTAQPAAAAPKKKAG
jgi:sulfide dehydrogenase [flavocytochrome c] flavoprotein chain